MVIPLYSVVFGLRNPQKQNRKMGAKQTFLFRIKWNLFYRHPIGVKWTHLTQNFLLHIQRLCITEIFSAKDQQKKYLLELSTHLLCASLLFDNNIDFR